MLTVSMLGITAFAAPSAQNCNTQLSNNKTRAIGSTWYNGASTCSVYLTARYDGGKKTGSGYGTYTASAVVSVNSPLQFYSAESEHEITYYENGVLNEYRTRTAAGNSN